jgi:eukaryotic-like serine/threonine-protein kinase
MPIPAPSRVANWVPAPLDAVVMRALERDRSNRYKRAGNMARDLDEYLQNARFSLEQMSEYMMNVFPPEKREEIPDGHAARIPELATPSSSNPGSSSRSASSSSSASHHPGMTNPGTPRAIASSGSRSGVAPPRESKRVLIGAVLVALAIGFGGALLALKSGSKPDESMAPQVVVTPTPAPRPVVQPLDLGAAAAVAPPPVESSRPSPSPDGARKGEKPAAPPVAVKAEDPTAPPKRHASQKSPAKPHAPQPKGSTVKTFEDDETPATKVQTFED